MKIKVRKWGNSIGLRIPSKVAWRWGIDENSVVELTEAADNKLIIRKKQVIPTLDEMLDSIPEGFEYLEDLVDFVASQSQTDEFRWRFCREK